MSKRKRTHDAKDTDRIRTFICIEIPEPIKHRIGELQHELRTVDARVSWVKPSNIHLTLKFLGDVSASRISAITEAVERITSSRNTFEVEIAGAGCFPSPGNPRVLWVGVSLSEELAELHATLENELVRIGFERDRRTFSAHLSIGRFRSSRGSRQLVEMAANRGFEATSFHPTDVVIMRSNLHPAGSIYTPQAIIPFAPR